MRFRRQGCKIRSLPEKPPNRPAAHNENERQQSARSAAKKMLLLARLEEKKTKRKSKTKNKTKTTREKKLSGAQQFLTTRRCLGKTGVGEKKGKASRFPNSPQNKAVAGGRVGGQGGGATVSHFEPRRRIRGNRPSTWPAFSLDSGRVSLEFPRAQNSTSAHQRQRTNTNAEGKRRRQRSENKERKEILLLFSVQRGHRGSFCAFAAGIRYFRVIFSIFY